MVLCDWFVSFNMLVFKVQSCYSLHQLLVPSYCRIARENEEAGSKRKRCSVVDVSDGESKIQCCKEQYCIGTWNVKSTSQ